MEYIFTNLPRYIKITPQSAFSSSIVESGHALLFMPTSSSIMAKLPDGTFITVGGSGTDVSSTTAEAGDVLSSKLFYNSGGTLTTGTIPTVSAAIESGAVVIPSGYIASSQSFPVSSGADVTLGYVSGGVFYELAFSGTSSVENGSSAGLSKYQWYLPAQSSVISNLIVSSGQSVILSSGTEYIYTAVMSGGQLHVPDGAAAVSTVLVSSGNQTMNVSSGGTANYTTADEGGTMTVSNGGAANYTTFNKGGNLFVSSGGTANYTLFSSGGSMFVSSGGIANDITLSLYADLVVSIGGIANDIRILNGGGLHISSGGTANNAILNFGNGGIFGTVNSFTISGGYLDVSSGGTANIGTIHESCHLDVKSSATVLSVTISSGGTMNVQRDGLALFITSMTGAVVSCDAGGTISYVTSSGITSSGGQ